MKYLKAYKLFESSGLRFNENHFDRDGVIETIETVKDILLELSDDNWDDINNRFYTEVETMPCRGMLSIYIYISKPSGFIRRDIEDIIDRLSSYLGSLGYENRGTKTGFNTNQCKVQFVSKIKWDVSKHLTEEVNEGHESESNSIESIKDIIEDMALDLKDVGLITNVSIPTDHQQQPFAGIYPGDNKGIYITISRDRLDSGFDYFMSSIDGSSQVIDSIEQLDELKIFITRVNSYLLDIGLSVERISYDYFDNNGEYVEDARTNIRSLINSINEDDDKILYLRLYYI